tara:strand:+ start:878 stop:1093 length:216 start_codon:yes stop_codon:yes gene_type:complete
LVPLVILVAPGLEFVKIITSSPLLPDVIPGADRVTELPVLTCPVEPVYTIPKDLWLGPSISLLLELNTWSP